jgi:hypothetical protein
LAHAYPSVWDRNFIRDLRRSISVPVLAVETPDSPTPEAEERLADYSGPAAIVNVEAATAITVDLLQA